MTSPRHPPGDKAVSKAPSQAELKTQIYRLLEDAQIPREERSRWTQRLMKHSYSDLELRWIADHLKKI